MNDVLDDLRAAADYQIRMSGSASDYLLDAENEIKRLRAEVERLRGDMPVAESLRVDVKCAEIERDEARAAVWKQAKEIADLRAEVERLRVVLRQCACSCKALRESCPQLEMDGTCPHLSAQEALEAKP